MHRIARISPLSLKDLRCPLCQVAGGRDASRHHPPSPDPGEIALREYRCRACGKDYTTEERAVRLKLEDLTIRDRSGQGHLYSREQLVRSLGRFVPKALTPQEREGLVSAVEERLEKRMSTPGHFIKHGSYIMVSEMIQHVQNAFRALIRQTRTQANANTLTRQRYRSAYSQYVLAVGPAGKVLTSAADVLEWLHRDEAFKGVPFTPVTGEPAWPRTQAVWNVPPAMPPMPIQFVVKNTYAKGKPRRRERMEYKEERVLSRLGRTFRRLPGLDCEPNDILTYVRWGLAGQSVVRTSQISTLIAEALRSTTETGYLRWIAIGKELSVEELHDEAHALALYPSPLLTFVRQAPRPIVRQSGPEPHRDLDPQESTDVASATPN